MWQSPCQCEEQALAERLHLRTIDHGRWANCFRDYILFFGSHVLIFTKSKKKIKQYFL
jgi:hypothetical protein